MANRSDFSSVLPRQIKRMLIMASIYGNWSKEEDRQARKDFIAAHAHHKRIVRDRQTAKTPVDDTPDTTETPVVAA